MTNPTRRIRDQGEERPIAIIAIRDLGTIQNSGLLDVDHEYLATKADIAAGASITIDLNGEFELEHSLVLVPGDTNCSVSFVDGTPTWAVNQIDLSAGEPVLVRLWSIDGTLYADWSVNGILNNLQRDDHGALSGTATMTIDHSFQSSEATVASGADVTVDISPPFLTHTIWLTPADATPTLAFTGGTITWDVSAPDFADGLAIHVIVEALSATVIRGSWKAIV